MYIVKWLFLTVFSKIYSGNLKKDEKKWNLVRKGVRKLLRNSQGQGGLEKISTTNEQAGTLEWHKKEGVGRQGIFRWEFQAYQCNLTKQLQFGKMVLNKLILRASCLGRVIKRNVVPCSVAMIQGGHHSCCEKGIAAYVWSWQLTLALSSWC